MMRYRVPGWVTRPGSMPWLSLHVWLALVSVLQSDWWFAGLWTLCVAFDLLDYARALRLGRLEVPT